MDHPTNSYQTQRLRIEHFQSDQKRRTFFETLNNLTSAPEMPLGQCERAFEYATNSGTTIYIARQRDSIIGTASVIISPKNPRTGYIEDVVKRKDMAYLRGVCQHLIGTIRGHEAKGLDLITLDCSPNLIGYYGVLGFKQIQGQVQVRYSIKNPLNPLEGNGIEIPFGEDHLIEQKFIHEGQRVMHIHNTTPPSNLQSLIDIATQSGCYKIIARSQKTLLKDWENNGFAPTGEVPMNLSRNTDADITIG